MSSANVINLRMARKRKQRAAKATQAEANRAKASVPGAVRRAAKAESNRRDAVLAGHRLDAGDAGKS